MINFNFYINSYKGFDVPKTRYVKFVPVYKGWGVELELNLNKTNWAELLLFIGRPGHLQMAVGLLGAAVRIEIYKNHTILANKAVSKKSWPWPTHK